jgi:hypothetical protein
MIEVDSAARVTCADGARTTRRVEILQLLWKPGTLESPGCHMRVAYVLAVAHIPAVRLPGPPEAN